MLTRRKVLGLKLGAKDNVVADRIMLNPRLLASVSDGATDSHSAFDLLHLPQQRTDQTRLATANSPTTMVREPGIARKDMFRRIGLGT